MNRDHRSAGTYLLGGFLLFAILAILILLGPEDVGRATTGTQVRIINSTPVNCSVSAAVGYNLISIPCVAGAPARSDIIGDTGLWAMYQYTPTTQDKWRVHNPNLPPWVVSDLEFLTRRAGYVLILNSSQSYQASGLLATSTDVPLEAGWNLVGYPSLNTSNVTLEIAGVNTTLTEVRSYDPVAGGYRSYLVLSQSGNLTNLTPGQGYWLNATTGTTWTVSS